MNKNKALWILIGLIIVVAVVWALFFILPQLNFPLILVSIVVLSGLISLWDLLFLARKRKRKAIEVGQAVKRPLVIDYARSFFPVLLAVLLIRSFVGSPFRIPSGSLKPTLLVGDILWGNKFDYGFRLPVTNTTIIPMSEPKRGDIAIFWWPPNHSIDYIKRIVGVPGDHISYVNKVLIINGKAATQKFLGMAIDEGPTGLMQTVIKKEEDLDGVKHDIYLEPSVPARNFHNLVVPPGYYFAMGDNRDDSADSRWFGFVPEHNFLAKASRVLFSWDGLRDRVRWSRIGLKIN